MNPFRESWGELLKGSMCKGDDCKGCRGCKCCPKCEPQGSTCEKAVEAVSPATTAKAQPVKRWGAPDEEYALG